MDHRPFAARLTRQPVAWDRDACQDARAGLDGFAPELRDLLGATAGCSPFLRALMARERDWLRPALAGPPEAALAEVIAAPGTAPPGDLGRALRLAKRRAALLVALCDLGGVWALEQVTGALTALADRGVRLALEHEIAAEIGRGRIPGAGPDDAADAAGMFVLAMGKMGAGELNYSSDIDLICLFDEERFGADWPEARAAFVRVTRRFTALLSEVTVEGYVFRTDLRLRPDAGVTPVCMAAGAAYAYYESQGRTWERAAHVKARPCAGDLAAGARYLESLTPFVWRRHLDYAAIEDAHDMRLRIRDHRGLHGAIGVEGHDMKLGRGGIREIEFFTQTRQLIAGGRDPALRDPTTTGGLAALAARGWIPQAAAVELATLYRAHREVEHRLQMVNDARTHAIPATAEGVARIAAFCGSDAAAFRAGLLDRLARTDRLTEGFFAPAEAAPGPELSDHARSIVAGWRAYPCLRSERAQAIFRRLSPLLLRQLGRAANPDEALVALDGFLAGLPSGVQLFALFQSNPALVDLIVDICATAPALARYLSRNPAVLDAVIGGSFFAPWPGMAGLRAGLEARLAAAADYERRLDAARIWLKEWHFRVGVHHLRGLIDADEAGKSYADLAGAVLAALWPAVVADFAARHGPPPGRGAVLLGMGSLGAGRLNAASDLDLILVYDAAAEDGSRGPRPLAARSYYARLTQAVMTALSARTAEGRLYPVDVRLRPSGRQGPLATSLEGWMAYQRDEAWAWEHLALTRARVVAGAADVGAEVEAFRRTMIGEAGQRPGLRAGVADMRRRLAGARPAEGPWDAKNGPGRLAEIELLAAMAALVTGNPARGTERQIAGAGALLPEADREILLDAWRFEWCLHCAARLLTETAPDPAALGEGGRAFLLRETAQDSAEALTARLAAGAAAAAAVLDRHLGEQ